MGEHNREDAGRWGSATRHSKQSDTEGKHGAQTLKLKLSVIYEKKQDCCEFMVRLVGKCTATWLHGYMATWSLFKIKKKI